MEFLAEIILEVILGIFVEIPMESEHVKTWIKTVFFLVLCGFIDGFVGFFFYQVCFVQRDLPGSVMIGAVLLFLLGVTIFGAVYGHKRNWKHE